MFTSGAQLTLFVFFNGTGAWVDGEKKLQSKLLLTSYF